MRLNRKNKLLFAGILLGLVVCYKMAFSKTADEIALYTKQRAMSERLKDAPRLLFSLKQREKQLDSVIAGSSVPVGTDFQNDLLRYLSQKSQSQPLSITDFKEPHISLSGEVRTNTYDFALEGPFGPSIKLLHEMETSGLFGTLRHVEFEKKKDYRTNVTSLVGRVFLEREESLAGK